MMILRWTPGKVEGTVAALVFVASFLAAMSGSVALPEVSIRWRPDAGAYVPANRAPPGQELALVFIGSSHCAGSNHAALPPAVERLKLILGERARRSGRTFTTVGIARDWRVDAGLRHLRRFGSFDEVTAGRNWVNSGVLRYVWEDFPGRAATPQVLVVERTVVDRRSADAVNGVIQDEHVVVRQVGSKEIERWVAKGAPMPALAPVARRTPATAHNDPRTRVDR